MVDLEKRLDSYLPVAVHDPVVGSDQPEVLRVELVQLGGHGPEKLEERLGIGIKVDPDPTAPGLATHLGKSPVVLAQVDEVAFIRHGDELARVGCVGPRVILAAQMFDGPGRFPNDGRAAVATRVGETPHRVVAPAHHDERRPELVEEEVAPCVGDIFDPARYHPRLGPEVLALQVEELGAGVAL